MAVSAFFKVDQFVEEKNHGQHNFSADQLAVAITNNAPTPATDTVLDTGTAHPPPAANDGYTAGGMNLTTSGSAHTGGVYKLSITDHLMTAGAGGIGPFRYALLINKTKGNRIIGFYDYGQAATMSLNETFNFNFDDAAGVLTDT